MARARVCGSSGRRPDMPHQHLEGGDTEFLWFTPSTNRFLPWVGTGGGHAEPGGEYFAPPLPVGISTRNATGRRVGVTRCMGHGMDTAVTMGTPLAPRPCAGGYPGRPPLRRPPCSAGHGRGLPDSGGLGCLRRRRPLLQQPHPRGGNRICPALRPAGEGGGFLGPQTGLALGFP